MKTICAFAFIARHIAAVNIFKAGQFANFASTTQRGKRRDRRMENFKLRVKPAIKLATSLISSSLSFKAGISKGVISTHTPNY